jgi:hypothetical protein
VGQQDGFIAGPVRRPRNLFAHAAGSIHDDTTARALGFKGGTVAGSVHMDQFPPLLLAAFGDEWFKAGCLSLYFRHATADSDPVQAFVERPAGPGTTRVAGMGPPASSRPGVQVRAWMTTAATTLVAEGTASIGRPAAASALFSRDLRPVDPARLRILNAVRPGACLGDVEVTVHAGRQQDIIARGAMTEPLPWYTGASPWGGPIASPSAVVDLLYSELMASLKASMGPHVGLFGAIEIRFHAGPVFLGRSYRVTGNVAAVSETPKTEVLWFDSQASAGNGPPAATMRMMLRQMKASSPRYGDEAEAS